MKKSIQRAIFCAVGLTLSACTADRRDYSGLAVSTKPQSRAIAVVRHLSACPSTTVGTISTIAPAKEPLASTGEGIGKSSAIGTAATAIGVDFAVEAVSIGLARANANRNGSFLATGAHVGGPERLVLASGTASERNGCIVVYHGPSGQTSDPSVAEGLRADIVSALGLSGQPAFYLELSSSISGGSRVLRMNYLQYAATSALSRGNGRKTVTVALGFGTPNKSADDPKTGLEVYLFNLGQLEIGSTYLADPSQVAVSGAKANGTYNMIAKVSESQNPTVALEALTTAFDKNKSALAEALKEAVQ